MQPTGDWTPALFEEHGRTLLGMIREHFELIRETPVSVPGDAAELLTLLATELPESGEDFSTILDDTWGKVIPNLVQWNHPAFYGYFPTCAGFPGVLGETLTAALNVNAMLWKTSPAASALEIVVMSWIAELVGYPKDSDSLLVNGASLANLYALAAARDSVLDFDVRQRGIAGTRTPVLRIYTSDQAHSSVDKAAITLGLGLDNVVRVPSDERYRMRPDLLTHAIRADLEDGYQPIAVVATAGTTSIAADDRLDLIAEVCAQYQVWLHVDAAYGGFWRAAPRLAGALEDLSVGDSLVVNPQKTLFVPLEATALFCRRRGVLANTFRLVPEYLRTAEPGETFDYMDFSPQLGRSFRALKIWWTLRSFGRAGIASRLDHSVGLAEELRAMVAEHPDWRCPVPSAYPLVCLRYEPQAVLTDNRLSEQRQQDLLDEFNAAILAEVNASGRAFVSHTVIRDGYVIRVSIGNIHTTGDDVERLWNLLTSTAGRQLAHWRRAAEPYAVGTGVSADR